MVLCDMMYDGESNKGKGKGEVVWSGPAERVVTSCPHLTSLE